MPQLREWITQVHELEKCYPVFPQLGNKQYISYWQDWLLNLATVTKEIQEPLLVCPGQTVLIRLKVRKDEDLSWPNRLV